MKTAAVLAVLAAVHKTLAADECAISCDPCKDLQKQQCLDNQLCQYSVSGDRHSGNDGGGCAAKSAIDRVTIEDGDEKGGVLRNRLKALGCGGFYSQKDCRVARLNGVAGGNCWWHDCDVEGNGGIPYCGEGRDGTGCRPDNYVLVPEKWAIDNEDCMKNWDEQNWGDTSNWDNTNSWDCTIGRFFTNAHWGQPVFHFINAANFNSWSSRKNCPTCSSLDTYPVWNDIKAHLAPHQGFLPRVVDGYRVPMTATVGIFHDKGCRSGVNVLFSTKEELPGIVLAGASYELTNYDAEYWGPLIDFYQCCSHPVLKSSITKAEFDNELGGLSDDWGENQKADYHNSANDDAWNAPADPDAWLDNHSQDDGWSDYFHSLSGDYAWDYLHEDGHSDYYNPFVINFKITIPSPPAQVQMDLSLPDDIADYTDNVFQTENRDNAADNPGHPGVRNVRSVPNPFGNGDPVYVHFQGGWLASSGANADYRGYLLYTVDATTEEQLFGIGGQKAAGPLSSDGKIQAYFPATDDFEYSDYDGDGSSDWGIRVKTLSIKNL